MVIKLWKWAKNDSAPQVLARHFQNSDITILLLLLYLFTNQYGPFVVIKRLKKIPLNTF